MDQMLVYLLGHKKFLNNPTNDTSKYLIHFTEWLKANDELEPYKPYMEEHDFKKCKIVVHYERA